jgi:hypothetical protein
MIVKGKARSGPAQLAAYLMRADDGERATILDWGVDEDGLYRDFMTWHVAGEATRGEKTLYHVQIAPDPRYKMTREEYLRGAEILAEELGMKDQPRRIVLHDGGDKPHAHVVFQRTELDTMTMWDDSFNYVKHERASKRMALEFGHEIVPGKHAKRDREKQPEFPRAELTTDEAQQEKRTGLSKADRVAQITALYQSADNGPALKAALEDAGYMLAKGDRGYVVVDQAGGQSVLTRNTGLKKKELEAFMRGVPLDSLPTVEEAKALQKQQRERQPAAPEPAAAAPEPEKPQGVEASKFLQPKPVEEPAPVPAAQKDPELAAILKSLADRQEEEARKYRELHAHQLRQQEYDLDRELKGKLDNFEAIQNEQRQALKDRHAEKRSGLGGFIDALQSRLNPVAAAEQAKERRRERQQLERRLQKERKDYLALLEQTKELEIENLKERQARDMRDLDRRNGEEKDRYVREHEEAKRILAELQEQQRQEALRRNDEPPTRSK